MLELWKLTAPSGISVRRSSPRSNAVISAYFNFSMTAACVESFLIKKGLKVFY